MPNGTGQALGGIIPDNPKDAVQDSHILRLEARMKDAENDLKPLAALAAQIRILAWLAGAASVAALTAAATLIFGTY